MHYSYVPCVIRVISPAMATHFIIKHKLDQSPEVLYL